jgi:hypothetical protein
VKQTAQTLTLTQRMPGLWLAAEQQQEARAVASRASASGQQLRQQQELIWASTVRRKNASTSDCCS